MMSSLLSRAVVRCHPQRSVASASAAAVKVLSARNISSTSLLTDQGSASRKVMREPPPDSLLSFSTQFYRHPSAPMVVGWVDLEAEPPKQDLPLSDAGPMECMNRNARVPKRANRGRRAVSRQARRAKKRALGNHRR